MRSELRKELKHGSGESGWVDEDAELYKYDDVIFNDVHADALKLQIDCSQ